MSQTFLDVAHDLILDAGAKAAFDADPDGYLAARGFDGLSPEDVADAVGFVVETLPADPAAALVDPGGDGDALARLAQLDPAVLEPETEPEPSIVLDDDPSGELDPLTEARATDPVDPADSADPGATSADEGAPGFEALAEPSLDPGFGVGFSPADVDDASPAAPELGHLLEHPADFELDATHVDELALESGDPISDAFAWAEHDAAPDVAQPEHGDDGLDLDLGL